MISVDFAPNEAWDDAILSLKLLLQPWKWKSGGELQAIKNTLLDSIAPSSYFFLTGRAALYHYLKALHLPTDAEVIIQAFTCTAVPLPIIANGLKPIYVDIESDTFSMDIKDLEKKYTHKAKVLVLQHTFGFTPKYKDQVLEFANKHNLHVLIDLAHGFDENAINKIMKHYNNATMLLSFGRSKAFSSVFGGALVTTDKSLVQKLTTIEESLPMPSTMFIFRCLLYKPLAMIIKSTYDIYIGKLIHKLVMTFNIIVPEITSKEKTGIYDELLAKAYPNALAILLLHQLKKYPETKQQRLEAVKKYNEQFKQSYPLEPIIRYPLLVENRDEVIKNSAEKNVYLGKWYNQPVGPEKVDLTKVNYIRGNSPVAERVSERIINLPYSPLIIPATIRPT